MICSWAFVFSSDLKKVSKNYPPKQPNPLGYIPVPSMPSQFNQNKKYNIIFYISSLNVSLNVFIKISGINLLPNFIKGSLKKSSCCSSRRCRGNCQPRVFTLASFFYYFLEIFATSPVSFRFADRGRQVVDAGRDDDTTTIPEMKKFYRFLKMKCFIGLTSTSTHWRWC